MYGTSVSDSDQKDLESGGGIILPQWHALHTAETYRHAGSKYWIKGVQVHSNW